SGSQPDRPRAARSWRLYCCGRIAKWKSIASWKRWDMLKNFHEGLARASCMTSQKVTSQKVTWQKVASLDVLRDGEAIGIDIAGTTIALFRLGDEVHATSGICSHEFGVLADGFIEPAD